MESLVDQVALLADAADEVGRRKLQTVLRDLTYSLESYDDTVHRLGYYVSVSSSLSPSNPTSIRTQSIKSCIVIDSTSTYKPQSFVLDSTSRFLSH